MPRKYMKITRRKNTRSKFRRKKKVSKRNYSRKKRVSKKYQKRGGFGSGSGSDTDDELNDLTDPNNMDEPEPEHPRPRPRRPSNSPIQEPISPVSSPEDIPRPMVPVGHPAPLGITPYVNTRGHALEQEHPASLGINTPRPRDALTPSAFTRIPRAFTGNILNEPEPEVAPAPEVVPAPAPAVAPVIDIVNDFVNDAPAPAPEVAPAPTSTRRTRSRWCCNRGSKKRTKKKKKKKQKKKKKKEKKKKK